MKQVMGIICLLAAITVQAQPRITFACSYYGDNAALTNERICIDNFEGVYGRNDHKDANSIIQRIMGHIGLPRNFVLVECNKIKNCMAVNLEAKTGQLRYIVYDKPFMKQIDMKAGTNWSAISIFAHEIGHHLSGHTLDGLGSRPDKELEADRFSGFVLYKMGATLQQAQAAMQALPDVDIISTHPPRANRLAAITEGWNDAWQTVQQEKELKQPVKLNSLDQIAGNLYDKGVLALETGKNSEAIKWFNSSLNLRPRNPLAYLSRGRAYGELKMYRLANKNFDSVTLYSPKEPLAHVYRGRYNTSQGLYFAAAVNFNQAWQLDSNCADMYAEKAIMLNAMKQYNGAILTAQTALEKGYKNVHIPLAQQGFACYQVKDYENALFFLKLALQVNPLYEYARTWWEKSRQAYINWLITVPIETKKEKE